MCDECTSHHKTCLVQSVYWHLAIKLYCTVLSFLRGGGEEKYSSKICSKGSARKLPNGGKISSIAEGKISSRKEKKRRKRKKKREREREKLKTRKICL